MYLNSEKSPNTQRKLLQNRIATYSWDKKQATYNMVKKDILSRRKGNLFHIKNTQKLKIIEHVNQSQQYNIYTTSLTKHS